MASTVLQQLYKLADGFTFHLGIFLSHVHADGKEPLCQPTLLRALMPILFNPPSSNTGARRLTMFYSDGRDSRSPYYPL